MVTKLIICTIFYLLLGARIVFAEFNFTSSQTTITSNEEIETTVTLSLQGQGNKTYYLEGAFKQEDTTNYFGLTWNDSSWIPYTSSNFTNLKSITTDQAGGWNGAVKVKLDESSSLFSGSGTYILRMKRFTTGGSPSWASNDITLTVSTPATSTPNPTPSPTPTPTPSAKKTTSQAATSAPNPTIPPTPKSSPSSASTKESSTQPKPQAKPDSKVASVAAAQASPTPTNIEIKSQKQSNLFLIVGLVLITAGIGLSIYIYLRNKILK